MNFNDDDEYYDVKEKMIAKTVLVVIISMIILIGVIIYGIHSFFDALFKTKYYSLDIDNSNRETIISLIEQEEGNYCESIYRIEFSKSFSNSIFYKVYCNDSDDINFSIDKIEFDTLAEYIKENGRTELR